MCSGTNWEKSLAYHCIVKTTYIQSKNISNLFRKLYMKLNPAKQNEPSHFCLDKTLSMKVKSHISWCVFLNIYYHDFSTN